MSIIGRIKTNFADVVNFGPQFLKRYLAHLTGAPAISVDIPGFGPINLRAGESDVYCIRQIYVDRQYDLALFPSVETRVKQKYFDILTSGRVPVIVDAGANIGAASLWFSNKYPEAKIVAVEPEPGNFSVLSMNARARPRILPLAAAVGSEPGFASIQNLGLGWAAQTTRSEKGVPIITMETIFENVMQGTPFIAKIDIEGFEGDLFSKNTEWLEEIYVVFIEPHDWMLPGKMTSQTFQRAMAKHDFELFISGENIIYVRK